MPLAVASRLLGSEITITSIERIDIEHGSSVRMTFVGCCIGGEEVDVRVEIAGSRGPTGWSSDLVEWDMRCDFDPPLTARDEDEITDAFQDALWPVFVAIADRIAPDQPR